MDRQKDGQKDRQTLFHRTLLATTGGPKSENLKGVIDTKYGNFDNPVFLNMKCLKEFKKFKNYVHVNHDGKN